MSKQKVEIVAEAELVWVVKKNPKRFGSNAHSRAQRYWNSETVQDYLDNGGTIADLKYDLGKNFLQLKDDSEE